MTNKEVQSITLESLRDWFKKEKWVRISSSGNIAGPCGTSKNKKNPDRCLPKAKAQSLTKGQRAATAAKKKKAGAKGKTVVKNTKKATVKKEGQLAEKRAYKILSPKDQAANDAKFDKRMSTLKDLKKGQRLHKAGKISDEDLHNLKVKAGVVSAVKKEGIKLAEVVAPSTIPSDIMYSLGNTKGLSGNHFYHIGTLLQALHRGSTIQEIEPEEKFYLHTVKFNPNVTIYPKVVNEDPEEGYDDDFSIENVNETDVVIYDNGVEGLDYPEPLPDGCKTANQNPNYSIYTHSRNFKVVKVEELTTGWDGDDYDDETNQHLRALYAACKLEYIPDVDETKEAPAGHYFTKSGNLVKGRMSKDAKERGARKSDPKDKQRSKVPKVTQYTETSDPQDGKAVPYGSGYKKVTKEDIRNLVVGLIHEMKNLNYNNFIQMVRDDMMAGAAPDEYPSDERVRKHAKALYSRYLKGASLDDLFETKDTIEEKDDRCTRIAKRKYDTWPSAYASGAVVRCRRGEIWKKK